MAKKLKADEVAAAPPADEVVPASDEVAAAPPADEVVPASDEVAAAPPADEVVPASDEVAVAPLSTCDWPERISYLDQLGTLIAESTTTAEKGVYEELQVILSEALMKVKAVSHKVADDLTHIAHDIEVLFKE